MISIALTVYGHVDIIALISRVLHNFKICYELYIFIQYYKLYLIFYVGCDTYSEKFISFNNYSKI